MRIYSSQSYTWSGFAVLSRKKQVGFEPEFRIMNTESVQIKNLFESNANYILTNI